MGLTYKDFLVSYTAHNCMQTIINGWTKVGIAIIMPLLSVEEYSSRLSSVESVEDILDQGASIH